MNVELRQNRFRATVTRRADLFVHPHGPAFWWRGSVLIDAGLNAVSTHYDLEEHVLTVVVITIVA
jgi:hypothetical protein